jgi:hypothetical protein
MFSGSGVGEFFKPVSIPAREAGASSSITPLHKAGDEPPAFWERGRPGKRRRGDDDGVFGDDVMRLSIAALRAILMGDAGALPPVPAWKKQMTADIPDTDMPVRQASEIYRHAEETAPAHALREKNATHTAPLPPPDAGEKILGMLEKLEKKGAAEVTVQDGQSIYAALLSAVAALPPDKDRPFF